MSRRRPYCFAAGTLVWTAGGSRPIESLRVGDRVLTASGAAETEVDGDWRVIELTLDIGRDLHGRDVLAISLLRPPEWLAANGISSEGDQLLLELDELRISGFATVRSIRGPPEIEAGAGRVVLATITHLNDDLFSLEFDDGNLLLPTGRHRFYSLDRDDWIPTRALEVGERLETAQGQVRVAGVSPVAGLYRVFNLEVEGDHEYLVGSSGVRAHNQCGGGGAGGGAASGGVDHIVLGKSIGLEERAASIGGRHLMAEADWQGAVIDAIVNPSTRISVDVAGLEGTGSVYSRVMAAIGRGASGRGGPLDWELAQLRQSGRLSTVDFFENANAIANPFR